MLLRRYVQATPTISTGRTSTLIHLHLERQQSNSGASTILGAERTTVFRQEPTPRALESTDTTPQNPEEQVSVTLSGNPTSISDHLFRAPGFNVTVTSIDWERPRVSRPWVWGGCQDAGVKPHKSTVNLQPLAICRRIRD